MDVPWNMESMMNLNMDDDGWCNLSDEMLSSFVMSALDYDPLIPDHDPLPDHTDPTRPVMPALDQDPLPDHTDQPRPVMPALDQDPLPDHTNPPRLSSALNNDPLPEHDLVPATLNYDPRPHHSICEPLIPVMSAALNYNPPTDHPIPRPIRPCLDDKLRRSLQIFEQSFRDGAVSILAQIWVPMRCGNQQVLSTRGHPFLHNQELSGYREVSRVFTFDAELRVGSHPGLPGRVFISKVPEWTPNVMHYKSKEFLRVHHAIDHQVRGSIGLPVFDEDDYCCAVMELVTKMEKLDFDEEVESACCALEAVDLSSTPLRHLYPQSLSLHQKATLDEIKEILNVICHAYRLPLALAWVPCTYTEDRDSVQVKVRRQKVLGPDEKSILCTRESACYWKDDHMQRFVHACTEHFLEEGQGIVGKAFLTNQPFFSPDVKEYDIREYPLVHHARKVGLNAGVAIRLRSANGEENDYVVELFLPVDMTDGAEQQRLLDNVYDSILRLCVSLRQVSNEELDMEKSFKVGLPESPRPPPIVECRHEQGESSSQGKKGKKVIKRKVIESHFCGNMKEAAKKLGVSATTLKTKCRKEGIPQWPSRKISLANSYLMKLKEVLESIGEIRGCLRFDRILQKIVAGRSFDLFNSSHFSNVRRDDESSWLD